MVMLSFLVYIERLVNIRYWKLTMKERLTGAYQVGRRVCNEFQLEVIGAGGAIFGTTYAIWNSGLSAICTEETCKAYIPNTHFYVGAGLSLTFAINAGYWYFAPQQPTDGISIQVNGGSESDIVETSSLLPHEPRPMRLPVKISYLLQIITVKVLGAGTADWAVLFAMPNELVNYFCQGKCDALPSNVHLGISLGIVLLSNANATYQLYLKSMQASHEEVMPPPRNRCLRFFSDASRVKNETSLEVLGAGAATWLIIYAIPKIFADINCANNQCPNYRQDIHMFVTMGLSVLSMVNARHQYHLKKINASSLKAAPTHQDVANYDDEYSLTLDL